MKNIVKFNANNFWEKLDTLINTKEVVIDRPKGSTHPRYSGSVYPHDYGYLKDILSSDGAGVDVWIESGNPKKVTGFISTFDALKNDIEIKLLIACSVSEMNEILKFHQKGNMVAYLTIRKD